MKGVRGVHLIRERVVLSDWNTPHGAHPERTGGACGLKVTLHLNDIDRGYKNKDMQLLSYIQSHRKGPCGKTEKGHLT